MADAPREDRLSSEQIWRLRRLTTPTVYNGWERITRTNAATDGFNLDEARDFAPDLGAIAGRAVTAVVRVSGPVEPDNRQRWARFRRYVADQPPGPKVVVLRDLDQPAVYGTVWGEIASATFRSLQCVGAIIDGGVRDIEEIRASGFKVLARRACVGHGVGTLVGFGEPVEVFGRRVEPGQLLHADRHGFLAIPPEDEGRLLEAATALDAAEATLLDAARASADSRDAFLEAFDAAIDRYIAQTNWIFPKRGEW